MLKHYKININTPINKLTRKQLDYILYGSDEPFHINVTSANGLKRESYEYFEGVLNHVKRLYFETTSEMARTFYGKFMSEKVCKVCRGKRLSPQALCVKINGKSIIDLTDM